MQNALNNLWSILSTFYACWEKKFSSLFLLLLSLDTFSREFITYKADALLKSFLELQTIIGKKSVSITKKAIMMEPTIEYASEITEFKEQAQCFNLYSSW